MKQDKSMSSHSGTSTQESCLECNGDRTAPKLTKSSRAQCPQCGSNRWTEAMKSPKDEDFLQPRTLYVSETYFNELTGRQENKNMTETQREETRRIFSDPELFEARVEEIMEDLAKKAPAILVDHDGDDEPGEAREEVEEQE
ncbi:hypothetical protein EG328_008650 [Venturia inaequalis]|uniref:Uncharacterized protein n=1 Tax=Venturia inaequalis TaxID=5025 RepID=A0A8H3Z8M5_VENIN|nr:hypothetical protein EG328_008650 [Venturia inaequalis]KAE9984477.1 hypothetical protein EG327_005006 [Venturia inaequalis]